MKKRMLTMKETLRRMAAAALLLPALALTGCIRDDLPPCPPMQVKIRVLDKNYFNIDAVARLTGLDHRVDENGPFRQYVQKLFYVLYDLHSGEVVMIRSLHDVQGDEPEATAYLPDDLPYGDYVLVVWGNIPSEEPILEDGNYMSYDMHTDAVEGFDPYVGCDTLHYTLEQNTDTVYLERVKGKLLIEATGLPDTVNWSRKHVLGLFGRLNVAEGYGAPGASVFNHTEWKPGARLLRHLRGPNGLRPREPRLRLLLRRPGKADPRAHPRRRGGGLPPQLHRRPALRLRPADGRVHHLCPHQRELGDAPRHGAGLRPEQRDA